jgi:hypothetical protein
MKLRWWRRLTVSLFTWRYCCCKQDDYEWWGAKKCERKRTWPILRAYGLGTRAEGPRKPRKNVSQDKRPGLEPRTSRIRSRNTDHCKMNILQPGTAYRRTELRFHFYLQRSSAKVMSALLQYRPVRHG